MPHILHAAYRTLAHRRPCHPRKLPLLTLLKYLLPAAVHIRANARRQAAGVGKVAVLAGVSTLKAVVQEGAVEHEALFVEGRFEALF